MSTRGELIGDETFRNELLFFYTVELATNQGGCEQRCASQFARGESFAWHVCSSSLFQLSSSVVRSAYLPSVIVQELLVQVALVVVSG